MRTSTIIGALVVTLGGCTPGSSSDESDGSTADDATAGATAGATGSTSGPSSGADDASSGGGAGGTVVLTFGVSNGVRMGPTLVDPLVGTVYGDLFHTEDVTLTGPVEGAVAAASVELAGVDLTTDEVSAVSWTSEPIPAGSYTFLGMYDLDGNFATTDQGPDAGDPVTLTSQAFEITADQETAFTVVFELVYG
jgi:hypothetical protein